MLLMLVELRDYRRLIWGAVRQIEWSTTGMMDMWMGVVMVGLRS